MSKILIDEATVKLAMEALELYQSKSSVQMFDDAVKALREALAEQPAQQWNPNDHYNDGWRDGMLAAQQHDRVRELECVIADLKAECRELIAQQQEPAFYRHEDGHLMTPDRAKFLGFDLNELQPLYTSPPASKPWVSLTDEERRGIREWQRIQGELGPVWAPMMLYLYEAIEAKLKEKNNG